MTELTTRNSTQRKLLLSLTMFLAFFLSSTICENPYLSDYYHKDCLSYKHCLFSQASNSKQNPSSELPVPISHCHIGSSCLHNFVKSESLKPLIREDTPTLTTPFNYSIPENNLIKSIFNPPRTII